MITAAAIGAQESEIPEELMSKYEVKLLRMLVLDEEFNANSKLNLN